jgi:hypothetical protein
MHHLPNTEKLVQTTASERHHLKMEKKRHVQGNTRVLNIYSGKVSKFRARCNSEAWETCFGMQSLGLL